MTKHMAQNERRRHIETEAVQFMSEYSQCDDLGDKARLADRHFSALLRIASEKPISGPLSVEITGSAAMTDTPRKQA